MVSNTTSPARRAGLFVLAAACVVLAAGTVAKTGHQDAPAPSPSIPSDLLLQKALDKGDVRSFTDLLNKVSPADRVGSYAYIALACLTGPSRVAQARPEVVDYLLSRGATVEAHNPGSKTPLLNAVEFGGRLSLIQFLLDRGASTHPKGFPNETALTVAARCGRRDVVRLLLGRKDAGELLEGKNGQAAQDVASRAGHKDIAAMLKKAADAEQVL